ncbi:hypothetical protein [Pseudonocardia phyllosphaerae]|uniref:hypothetical protein n=1 Tax=Pseudonocardia phyllosphaerae TaxID=3390502 RepID=UPI003978AB10
MTQPDADEQVVAKYVAYACWTWVVTMVLTVAASLLLVIVSAGELGVGALLVNGAQSALVLAAATALRRRRESWGRVLLVLMAWLAVPTAVFAFATGNWVGVLLNLAAASTVGVLMDRRVKEACKRASAPSSAPPWGQS